MEKESAGVDKQSIESGEVIVFRCDEQAEHWKNKKGIESNKGIQPLLIFWVVSEYVI